MVFEFFFCHVVIDVECLNALGCYVVFVLQNAQKEVFGANDGTFEHFGLEVGDLQNLLSLFHKRDVP